jgi:Domain of unknown function (DUF4265)
MLSHGSEFHSNRWPQDRGELVKIRIALDRDAPYEAETLWARAIGDGVFIVDNVPFFAYGLSRGDRIYAQRSDDSVLEYSGVAQHSGHSTYRVFLGEAQEVRVDEYWRQLEALGCEREIGTRRLWAIDLSPEVDIFKAYDVFEDGEAEGVWEFEEVHVGHEVPSA